MARSKGLRIEWSKVHLIQFLRLICFAFLPSSISFVQISSVSHGLAKSNVILPRIKTRGALTFMSSLLQGCIDVNNIVEQNKVVVFGVSDCPQTRRTTSMLSDSKVKFVCIMLDQVENGPHMMQSITVTTGRRTAPVIYVNKSFLGGIDHLIAMNANGYLYELLKDVGAFSPTEMDEYKADWSNPSGMSMAESYKTNSLA